MEPWSRYAPDEVVYAGHLTGRVTVKHFQSVDGGKFDFETTAPLGSRAATVVALTTDGQVIVVKQFRVGPEAIMWECPGGVVEPHEDPLLAAGRELAEETGYQAETVTVLGTAYDHAYSNLERHYFLAVGCKPSSSQQLDDLERAEVALLTTDEFIDNARTGKMTNGLAALLAYDYLVDQTESRDQLPVGS